MVSFAGEDEIHFRRVHGCLNTTQQAPHWSSLTTLLLFIAFFFSLNKPLFKNRFRHSLSQTESVPNFLSKQWKIYKRIFPGTPSDLFKGKRHPAQRLMLSGCLIWSGSHLFPQLISQLASFLSSHLAVYQTSFNWLIMRHLSFYLTMVRISLISMLHQPICHLCIFSLTVTHHSCFISSIYQLSIHVSILVYHLCTYHVLSTNHLNFSISIIYFI